MFDYFEDALGETVENLTTEKVTTVLIFLLAISVHCHSVRETWFYTMRKSENIRAIYDTVKTVDPYVCSLKMKGSAIYAVKLLMQKNSQSSMNNWPEEIYMSVNRVLYKEFIKGLSRSEVPPNRCWLGQS